MPRRRHRPTVQAPFFCAALGKNRRETLRLETDKERRIAVAMTFARFPRSLAPDQFFHAPVHAWAQCGCLHSRLREGLCLPSAYFVCILEYALGNREAPWLVLKAKTKEIPS